MDKILISGVRSYLIGLLSVVHNANCVRLALRVKTSHDRLSRVLKTSGGRVLALVSSLILKTLENFSKGVLIIDDTTITKQFAKVIEGCGWLWSSNDERVVFGYQVVVLLWSTPCFRIPLRWVFYKKSGDKKKQITKIDIALDLLEYAKNTLKINPEKVLFDSFYSAEKILRCLEECGWSYVTKIKSNRVLNQSQVKKLHRHPYWEETGKLSCGLSARVIRHGKRYFLTNDFLTPKKEVIVYYDDRWAIEEMFRVLHSRLKIDTCESRSFTAQSHHAAFVMVAFALLGSEKTRAELSTYYTIHDLCLSDPDYASQVVDSLMNQMDFRSA